MTHLLLTGILAVVLLPLGIVFLVIGLLADDVRSGEPEGFLYVGAPLLAAGMLLGAVALVLWRREVERRRRRRAGPRAIAHVLHADLKPGIRVGAMLTYDLTVRFDPGGTVMRRVLVVPGTQLVEGDTIEIAYDATDPSNFEPATGRRGA